jgi:NAD(P)-dependent dehydrogenase (short-subunit alcohol dehydrogenase family)/acyl carrier protein
VLLPGTGFLELALAAARRLGAQQVGELTLQAPLVFPEALAMQLQVSVAGPDEEGRRELHIYSRPHDGEEESEQGGWTLNAEGIISASAPPPLTPLGSWPPEGAEPIDAADLYERLADAGVEYGPAFQGLTAAWRVGDAVCSEVSLGGDQAGEAGRYAIHPALFDAALHGLGLASGEEAIAPRLPFSFTGISVHSEGATQLRAKLEPKGEGVSLALYGATGSPLAQIDSLAMRDLSPEQIRGAQRKAEGLLAIQWNEISLPPQGDDAAEIELWRLRPGTEGNAAENARDASERALLAIQEFLAREPSAQAPLAILTEGAVAAKDGEDADPAAASVWGLIRSAQIEHPGRLLLIDTDGSEASESALGAVLDTAEPQLALREGTALVPRATRVGSEDKAPDFPLDPARTVLVTGATGGLGSLLARHLVEEHGARHLLLASRTGADAKGAGDLVAGLEELGADVELCACDVSDRGQLEALLAKAPKAHPLGGVFHVAGAVSDATIETLSPEQLEPVFAPKADAAWHLHELSKESELSVFVLFSSAAGTLGSPGQANYAAANAFLDSLAMKRQAEGLPATSIAWGMWGRESAMTSGLSAIDKARMARSGVVALTDEQGLSLLDRTIESGLPQALALRLERSGLRAQVKAGILPPLLRGLVPLSQGHPAQGGELARGLAAVPAEERGAFMLEAVRSEVAAVLGHASATAVDPERPFKELGFDSLAAVELRNRLSVTSGVHLAATAVFDYPNSSKLADHLLGELDQGGRAAAVSGLDKLELALAAVPGEDPERLKLATRLRALATSLEGNGRVEAKVSRGQLESASDEELLEFIDEQTGGADRNGQ